VTGGAVIERALSWLSDSTTAALAFFDHLPRWVQVAIVAVVCIAVVAGMHFDELKRERDWCEFRRWQRWRRRIAQLVLPRELR
jgi:hypothetical protein